MQQFYNPQIVFTNRDFISDIGKQQKSVSNVLKKGQTPSEHKFNWYDIQYGHKFWNKQPSPTIIRPPLQTQGNPIPFFLKHTDEMLVDVCGVLYHNKDLKVSPVKAFTQF